MSKLIRVARAIVVALPVVAAGSAETPPAQATAHALLAAHNEAREAEGLPPLVLDETLSHAAQGHAEDMAARDETSHVGGDGSTALERTRRAGYRGRKVGENVARGQRSVAAVMKAWMESEGHRRNILADYTQMGAAKIENDEGEPFWCVVFGVPHVPIDAEEAARVVSTGVDAARKAAGASALRPDPKLSTVARNLASEWIESAAKPESERRPPDLASAMKRAGVRYADAAVVLGAGDPTAEAFLRSSLADPDRRSTLLDDFDAIGIGCAADAEGAPFWCVVLVER